MDTNHNKVVYINKGEHDNLHEHTLYLHTINSPTKIYSFKKLEYIYQHFQDSEKTYETDPHIDRQVPDNTLYPHINNDVEYGLWTI